jgi:hypothetical protein
MSKTTSHQPDQDDLPGFGPAQIPEPDDLDEELLEEQFPGQESHPTSTAPSTTSPSQSRPPPAPESREIPSPSTTGSTEHDEDLAEGLEFLAGGLFELFGQTMNRMARVRRRGQRTGRWLVSDDEAEAFAEPVARIAERHLPDELKTGDAKDVVIAGSVALEYGVRNMADLEEPTAALPPQQQQRIQEPGPPPPAPPPVEPAAQPRSQAGPSAAAEEAPLVPPTI